MLNGVGEEVNESNSGAGSTKKSVSVESPLSGDDASQNAADLENEAGDDLTLSPHEKKLQQIMLLESENIQDDRKDGEEECLEGQNEGDDRKNNEECSAAEEVPCDNSESDHCNDLPIHELQKKRNQEENKPVPKPRVHKTRNTSASAENISIPSLDSCYKPSPQPRTMLRKSGRVEDNELNRSEGKITSRNGFSPFSAPSSLTTLNAQATPRKKLLAESPGPEGPWLESTSPPFSINFTSHNERSGESDLLMCGEAPPVKDQKMISTSDLKLEDNSRKSPSVIEVMMTTVYEKTKKFEKSTDDSSDETVKIVEGQIVTDTIQEVSVNDQSEHGEAKNTSKDSVKKLSETKERVLQNPKASLSDRSLSSVLLKKKVKAVPSGTPVSSQYLGTLKVLEDKRMQKSSTEFDKADGLRAAVFQNWLEKKRTFLLELKRIEKKKAENLRSNAEKEEAVKREEAIASFEAWKKKKGREAKKLSEKKKLEELKKKKAAEQNEEKTEAAQKAFEKWKERKAEYLREQSRKEKQSERIRKKKEEELVAEKKRDSMSAVEKWNEKKEEYIKQKKVEKSLERRKQEIQQAKKEEKNKKAMEEYERWLKKERREQLEKKQKKLQAVRGDEVPSPWSPPGKVTYSRNY
ncbi:microtubule-associated protein 9 isoform X1 [Gymnogyps californianus]|uniref:microtubule-associated protein 9 isoform X1 n=1 Tax=Gymnogyps californianus TaxID=33616 RepID=UPI0021C6263B|nr:microtubule-associated protein 9 isoform X1 [Gymnogyps californianus]